MKEAILLTDGYKLDHRRQYPENTEYVYSNWTPRSCHYYPEATEGAVVFGIQYFIDESFSLSIVAQVINNMSPQAVHVLEPHSYRVQDLINAYWGDIATPIPDFRGYLKVYPDRGALQRYGGDSTKNVICSKVRDPKTGQLSGFKIENPEVIEENQDLPLVVIDDLCDGGGTFKGIAQLLESHCPNRDRAIYVTHMVNPKGIATLSENYKEVYFTNSYRDWGREVLPDNVKVIEVV